MRARALTGDRRKVRLSPWRTRGCIMCTCARAQRRRRQQPGGSPIPGLSRGKMERERERLEQPPPLFWPRLAFSLAPAGLRSCSPRHIGANAGPLYLPLAGLLSLSPSFLLLSFALSCSIRGLLYTYVCVFMWSPPVFVWDRSRELPVWQWRQPIRSCIYTFTGTHGPVFAPATDWAQASMRIIYSTIRSTWYARTCVLRERSKCIYMDECLWAGTVGRFLYATQCGECSGKVQFEFWREKNSVHTSCRLCILICMHIYKRREKNYIRWAAVV